MSEVTDLPIKLPGKPAFSRVMTVISRDGKHYLSLVVNGKASEHAFDTRDQAVAAVDEERKKGPNDYHSSDTSIVTSP